MSDWLKQSEARAGMIVKLDDGFPCHRAGRAVLRENDGGIYFDCTCGHHYIDLGKEFDDGYCVGIYKE